MNSLNNNINSIKNLIIKYEFKILNVLLLLAIFNSLSHLIRKNFLGDRVDFWDFHVYWCSASKFINNINPYGGAEIKDCLSAFNFDLYFSYPPIVLKSISFLGYLDFNMAKLSWIIIISLSFGLIVFYSKKIFEFKKFYFYTLVTIFGFGGLIWSALLSGNISIILYSILTIGIYFLTINRLNVYYLSIIIISSVKFPFLIFFSLPIFLFGFKELKNSIIFFGITALIYYMQFYLSQDLFLSFINSTISYKSENFLLIHGTGIGIHGMIDLYQNYLHSLTNINLFEPSSIFSFLIHISFSSIIFFTSFVLFKRNNLNNKNIKLLISFFMIIFLCCFPRISPYDFFLIIPSIFYIFEKSNIRKLGVNWNFLVALTSIIILSVYDSKNPAFILSLIIFISFYLEIKKKNPFNLNVKLVK